MAETFQIKIRDVRSVDAEAISYLSEQLGYPTSSEEVYSRIHKIVESPQDQSFVATSQDEQVVGWIHVFATMRLESEPFAEIGGIIVAESYQNRGIGKALLKRAQDWAVSLEKDI